jgi:hypothetical protein
MKDLYYTIKQRIRLYREGITNLYRWRKVIYRDKDFDHWYIYEILKTKLQFQAEHIRKNGIHESANEDVAKIRECIELLDKVQNEYYIDEFLRSKADWDQDSSEQAIQKHDNARKELFKLLEENIEDWWD